MPKGGGFNLGPGGRGGSAVRMWERYSHGQQADARKHEANELRDEMGRIFEGVGIGMDTLDYMELQVNARHPPSPQKGAGKGKVISKLIPVVAGGQKRKRVVVEGEFASAK